MPYSEITERSPFYYYIIRKMVIMGLALSRSTYNMIHDSTAQLIAIWWVAHEFKKRTAYVRKY